MSILSKKMGLYDTIKVLAETEDYTLFKAESSEGEGTMKSYQVFPGIELIYNDFNMGNCFHGKKPVSDIMEINHCRQGRFECDIQNGASIYIQEGDLSVSMLSNKGQHSCFSLNRYSGVSVMIDFSIADKSISNILSDTSIDLYALRGKLCPENECFIMRATDSIEHIFSELYTVPDAVKMGYFKLKVLELLLFLSVVDASQRLNERQYFNKNQIDIVKSIHRHMTKNIDRHYTLVELSERFEIPLTAMKTCFKVVYGMSIYAYMRAYRMNAAALALCQDSDNISDIASRYGYINSSKFSAAFRDVMGMCPLEYRKLNRTPAKEKNVRV